MASGFRRRLWAVVNPTKAQRIVGWHRAWVSAPRAPLSRFSPNPKQSCDNRHIVGSRPVATATRRNKLDIRRFYSPINHACSRDRSRPYNSIQMASGFRRRLWAVVNPTKALRIVGWHRAWVSAHQCAPASFSPIPKQSCDNRHIVGSRPVATATRRNKLNIKRFTAPSTPPAVATGRDPTTTNTPPKCIGLMLVHRPS